MSHPKFDIEYHPDVLKEDLPKISSAEKQRIRKAIEKKLFDTPQNFGVRLRKTLKNYWKLRVGDYRVIFKITGKKILVLKIGHRKEVYEPHLKRRFS